MSTETAPDSCPFCGAGILGVPQSGVMVFCCGTVVSPGNVYTTQPETCRDAERERLTRERDEARAERDAEKERADGNLDAFQKMLTMKDAVRAGLGLCLQEKSNLLARAKRLEKDWDAWPDLQREWFGDKYAAMQPMEAVRARIEDSEARIKRLEEALSANRVFHTPIALRRRGGEWDEYELDAIRRTREEIGAT